MVDYGKEICDSYPGYTHFPCFGLLSIAVFNWLHIIQFLCRKRIIVMTKVNIYIQW